MKVAHWSMFNHSGMHAVAESISAAERVLGIDSVCVNLDQPADFDKFVDYDIHISHTHFPDQLRRRIKDPKLVWFIHGTPEHVFQSSVEANANKSYGAGDGWMLALHWLQTANEIVTMWPRHQAIWQSMCQKGRKIELVPFGVDRSFWKPVDSMGKFAGEPSLFTGENAHYFKWPLDLFILWPWVYPRVRGNPCLHAVYLPNDVHRWFFPLVNMNGASYASHINSLTFSPEILRNAFSSVDFYIGLVRYGDYNRIGMEANASGCSTISYAGNPYSDYWLTEGDQRVMAEELLKILNGETPPRNKEAVPDISETAKAMIEIYNRM